MNQTQTHARPLLRAGLLLSIVVAGFAQVDDAFADGGSRAPIAGEVIAVQHTSHLFVGDAAGRLHLASDPRALDGHAVDWSRRQELPLGEVSQFALGEPWLSMALVKIGDFIYLPQMRSEGGAPVLSLVDGIDDLRRIGVNAENYGRIVLDKAAWEDRYGMRTEGLTFGHFSLSGAMPRPAVDEPSRVETEDGVS